MQRFQAFKFDLMPSGQQERQMRRIAGSCRFLDNKALALQKARYEQGEKKRDEHPGARDGNLAREGRDTPGWPVDRTTRVVGSRNPPK